MDRKSIAQPCKPSRPPSIPRSISNEDHEVAGEPYSQYAIIVCLLLDAAGGFEQW